MIEVTIQNFQSIRKVSLRIDRFTALVGRSNIGKSAIVRAIRCALTGAAGTEFVRHDPETCARLLKGNKKCKCFTSVRLKMNGISLLWEKGDAVNKYTVVKDGVEQVYTKVERGTPEFLSPEFSLVKVGDSKDLVQVSEQFDPIFLLDQSGATVADVLSDVAKLDSINEAMRLAEKDRREAVSTRKVREKDLKAIRDELSAYDGLDSTVARARRVQEEYEGVLAASKRLQELVAYRQSLRDQVTAAKLLKAATEPDLPDRDVLSSQYTKASQLEKLARRSVQLRGLVKCMREALAPDLPDHSSLEASHSKAKELEVFAGRLVVVRKQIKALLVVQGTSLMDEAPVQKALNRTVLLGEWASRVRGLVGLLKGSEKLQQSLAAPDACSKPLEKVVRLAAFSQRYETLVGQVGDLEESLERAVEDEKGLRQEFNELGACPTCSQRLSPEHMLGHS
jgi:ribosomal protein L17